VSLSSWSANSSFASMLAAALPQLSQNVFGLNRDRFVGDLHAMPNFCWLSSRGLPGTHGTKAISMPIDNLFRISDLRAMKCRKFQQLSKFPTTYFGPGDAPRLDVLRGRCILEAVFVDLQRRNFRFQGRSMDPQFCSRSCRSGYPSMAFAQSSLNDLFLLGSKPP
jgi:hypothetical protein